MNVVLFVVGVVLLVVSVVDILWTTLWVDGGSGPLSRRLTSGLWRGLESLAGDHSRVLSLAGPLMLVATLVVWVAFIWGGWTLVFASAENALINARESTGVSWTGRIYFVAYAMFTMGNGDFYPGGSAWQLAAALTTASGMLFVTMGVSYVLSVLGAVSQKRAFANTVTGLGGRSETIVARGWNGENFDGLHFSLDTLAADIDHLAEQHLSYPILNYYHCEQAEQASAIGVAVFDDALTLLRFGVPEADRPNRALLESAWSANENYLDSLNMSLADSVHEPPPSPDLDALEDAGVPTVPDDEFDVAVTNLRERRMRLLDVVEADAWYWPPLEQ